MKKLIITTMLAAAYAAPALAVDASSSTNTNTSTDVSTTQDSGVSLSGKAKVLPHATINTGDNTASTDVRTSVDADTTANAARTDTSMNVENKSYHNTSGKGHKYGHDRDRDR